MKLKLLILSVVIFVFSSCGVLVRMSGDGQRFADGIYFNGRTAPSAPKDYIPTYKANVNRKFDSSSYLAGTVNVFVVADGFLYNRWYWDPWYNPWYNPWYGPGWGPYYPYGPWYGPGWGPYYPYDPWYGPGWGPWYPYRPWYPGYYCRTVYPVRSGHSPVGGYRGVNPVHSGGMGSYSGGRYRGTGSYTGGGRPYPGGTGPASVNRGGGSMNGSPTGGRNQYTPGGVNRGGGSMGGGSFGGGARGGMGGGSYGGSRGGMGGGRR